MPILDADFKAALEGPVVYPAWFIYLDVDGDPVRVTSAGYSVTFGVEDDPDISEQTFSAIDPSALEVGSAVQRQGGSETLSVTLSGLLGVDQEALDAIADRSKWQGRIVRLWMGVRDENGEFIGAVAPYYTGYMMSVEISPSPQSQTINLSVENYLSLLSNAPNRTWLDQNVYDPADTSPAASLGGVNGARTGPAAGVGFVGADSGGGGGGARGGLAVMVNV